MLYAVNSVDREKIIEYSYCHQGAFNITSQSVLPITNQKNIYKSPNLQLLSKAHILGKNKRILR